MDVMGKTENEKRLIDADALRQEIERIYLKHFAKSREKFVQDTFKAMFNRINNAKTVDSVEVVRCRDCKHRYEDSWCEYVDDDDSFYCARGKRKEGAD